MPTRRSETARLQMKISEVEERKEGVENMANKTEMFPITPMIINGKFR